MVEFTILGEPASKANSRKLVHIPVKGGGKRPAVIKSAKARNYVETARLQMPQLNPLLTGELVAHIWIWYASQRPDLDESVILDSMQGKIYENDRQVREKHVHHGIDRENPRTRIIIAPRTEAMK